MLQLSVVCNTHWGNQGPRWPMFPLRLIHNSAGKPCQFCNLNVSRIPSPSFQTHRNDHRWGSQHLLSPLHPQTPPELSVVAVQGQGWLREEEVLPEWLGPSMHYASLASHVTANRPKIYLTTTKTTDAHSSNTASEQRPQPPFESGCHPSLLRNIWTQHGLSQ